MEQYRLISPFLRLFPFQPWLPEEPHRCPRLLLLRPLPAAELRLAPKDRLHRRTSQDVCGQLPQRPGELAVCVKWGWVGWDHYVCKKKTKRKDPPSKKKQKRKTEKEEKKREKQKEDKTRVGKGEWSEEGVVVVYPGTCSVLSDLCESPSPTTTTTTALPHINLRGWGFDWF